MPIKIKSKTYETKEEKRRDFLIGFGGWFVVNVLLLWLGQNSAVRVGDEYVIWFVVNVLLLSLGLRALLINIAGLIYLGFTRKWVAFGALAAIGVVLLLVLFFVPACLVLES